MGLMRLLAVALALSLAPFEAGSRDALVIWDSRCEECHGEPLVFARKYMWNVGGTLQGQHHIDTLDLFMRNHYIPDHEIQSIHDMLLENANSPLRFDAECGECHGDAHAFVEASLWVSSKEITGLKSGAELGEFLPTHRDLTDEDVDFYRRLFIRIDDGDIY